jgi:hypothetical protein
MQATFSIPDTSLATDAPGMTIAKVHNTRRNQARGSRRNGTTESLDRNIR